MKDRIVFTVFCLLLTGCNLGDNKNHNTGHAYELFNKALTYNLRNMDSLALPLYDSAIILAPNNAEFYANRGLTLYELGDTAAALNDYFKAIELDSLDTTTYMNIGTLFGDRGDYKTSLHYARKALDLGDKYVYYNIGLDLYMLKDYEGARDSFLSFLENNPKAPQEIALYCLGESYARLNQMENAKLCWDKANELAGYDIRSELDSRLDDFVFRK